MKLIFWVFFNLVILLLSFSCKKQENEPNNKLDIFGSIVLHFHPQIDTNNISLGRIYSDSLGRRIQLNVAQFYINYVDFHGIAVNPYTFSGARQYQLVKVNQEEYIIDRVMAMSYTSLSFRIGVSISENHQNPQSFPITDLLYAANDTTWYGNTIQGYVFMNISGLVDTSANNNGALDFPINFKIGSDTLCQKVTMPLHSTPWILHKNETVHIHINYDLAVLFENINFKTQNNSTSYTNFELADTIAHNIPNMFSYAN